MIMSVNKILPLRAAPDDAARTLLRLRLRVAMPAFASAPATLPCDPANAAPVNSAADTRPREEICIG